MSQEWLVSGWKKQLAIDALYSILNRSMNTGPFEYKFLNLRSIIKKSIGIHAVERCPSL